jgi:endonuclease/exonuclease/phosphatase (EEP) superfamily protein YafD
MKTHPGHRARRPKLQAWLLARAAATLLALLLGMLGQRHWLLDLLAHWRVQYGVVLAACGLGLLWLRQWRSAGLALLAALGVGATVVHGTGWPFAPAQAATAALRFVTFNQHARNANAPAIGDWLERSRADIVALQELSSPHAVQALAAALPSYPYRQSQHGRWADITVFSRWPVLDAQQVELVPGGARALQLRIDWQGRPVTVVAVHLHWPVGANNVRLRNAELQALAELARRTPGPLLIGGDFNITRWSPVFEAALAAAPLAECARGQGLVSSWPSFFPPAAIRIDHCLASPHWRVLHAESGPALGSDHRPVLSDLALQR